MIPSVWLAEVARATVRLAELLQSTYYCNEVLYSTTRVEGNRPTYCTCVHTTSSYSTYCTAKFLATVRSGGWCTAFCGSGLRRSQQSNQSQTLTTISPDESQYDSPCKLAYLQPFLEQGMHSCSLRCEKEGCQDECYGQLE